MNSRWIHSRQAFKCGRRAWRSLTVFAIIVLVPIVASAMEPVRATLEKDAAWIGEAVPLVVTLYSPGPFSGTASFDLPDLPRTALVKMGNPTVGSEEIDGESFLTQRHEFRLFTQQAGEIVIPEFRVRFSGKKNFTSDPEPMAGHTSELRFESSRPPGTEGMGVVVSATKMEVQQTWSPGEVREIQAGDIIERTLVRTAEGTTAMMLPPAAIGAPDGVSVHTASPQVNDKVERGKATAQRRDTVKYQFQHTGSFAVPDLAFVWWDPEEETLKRETLPGMTIQVTAVPGSVTAPSEGKNKTFSTVWMVAAAAFILGVAPLAYKALRGWIASWRQHRNATELRAVRDLRVACRSNDATRAYSALMACLAARRAIERWDSTESNQLACRSLREQLDALSRHLFAPRAPTTSWDGSQLWKAFSQVKNELHHHPRRSHRTVLGALNPTTPSAPAEYRPAEIRRARLFRTHTQTGLDDGTLAAEAHRR